MKELKRGDLVWHRTYNRGIVVREMNSKAMVGVHFENQTYGRNCHRDTLYVKGDAVDYKSANINKWTTNSDATFFETMYHNPRNTSNFTLRVTKKIHGKDLRVIAYAKEIRHKTDYHTQRAVEEGISRKEAKMRNFAELYGGGPNTFGNCGTISGRVTLSEPNFQEVEPKTNKYSFEKIEARIAALNIDKEGKYAMIEKLRIMQLRSKLDELLKELES